MEYNLDLIEITENSVRHPWEIARARTLIDILKESPLKGNAIKILDIGCGDAFILGQLEDRFTIASYDGVDTSLSEVQMKKMSVPDKEIYFHRQYDLLKNCRPNLILMLDVLEHIDDDRAFLKEIVETYATPNTYFLITVPAFNFLFSSHDEFLGHYRRYTLKKIKNISLTNNLEIHFCGYAFSLLLPLRLISSILQKIFKRNITSQKGVGVWNHGKFLTKIIETLMIIDNDLSFRLTKIAITIPGLTAWVLCKKK